jgi:DNA (cytosine-5)-methyltransferase 1
MATTRGGYFVLDLYCGAGGASMGYSQAGMQILGVDIDPPDNYPFAVIQADVPEFLNKTADLLVDCFSLIHASPPCQAFSTLKAVHKDVFHPDLIEVTRNFLEFSGVPFVIENVPNAPLINPIMLCGTMFGLRLFRHRLFEFGNINNAHILTPPHIPHSQLGLKAPKTSREPDYSKGEVHSIYGHFSGVQKAKIAMGIPWMTRNQLSQAIPPAYTKYIADYLINSNIIQPVTLPDYVKAFNFVHS